MDLETFANSLDRIGNQLSAAGALAGPVLPDVPPIERHVDCGSCSGCCHMAVFLRPEEYEAGYAVQRGTHILQRREDTGACVYLDAERGCTIYERRPIACRAFACADFVANTSGDVAALAAEHPEFRKVIAEGRKRLYRPTIPPRAATMSFNFEAMTEVAAASEVIAGAPALPASVRDFLNAALVGIKLLPDGPPHYLAGELGEQPGRWMISIRASGHLCLGPSSHEVSSVNAEVKRVWLRAVKLLARPPQVAAKPREELAAVSATREAYMGEAAPRLDVV